MFDLKDGVKYHFEIAKECCDWMDEHNKNPIQDSIDEIESKLARWICSCKYIKKNNANKKPHKKPASKHRRNKHIRNRTHGRHH